MGNGLSRQLWGNASHDLATMGRRGDSLGTTLRWFDSRLKSATLGALTDNNHGHGEAYSTVGFDRFTDSHGAVVSSRRGDSLQSRWGGSPVQPPPMPDGMESHRE